MILVFLINHIEQDFGSIGSYVLNIIPHYGRQSIVSKFKVGEYYQHPRLPRHVIKVTGINDKYIDIAIYDEILIDLDYHLVQQLGKHLYPTYLGELEHLPAYNSPLYKAINS